MGNKLFYRVSLPVFALALAGLFPMKGGAQTIRPSTQKELKIYDPSPSGTGNIGLRAASGTGSYSLTLPTSAPAANQVLGVSSSSGGVATLTWTTVSVSAVSTFSGGTTGLTPSTATSGAVTLAGTLSVTNGGTGATSLTGIALGNGTGAFTGITTSSGIAGALSDETGSGALVFGTSPTVTTLTVASGGATISAGGLTVTAGGASVNGNILIDNSGSAGELRLREPSGSGSHYTAFRAQAQSVDVTYTLPASDGTSGSVLSTNGSGTLSWAAGGGVTSFSAGTTGFTPSSATTGAITLGGTLSVTNGGTGRTSHTAFMPIVGGSTTTGAQQSVSAGTISGQALLYQGTSAIPSFGALNLAGGTNIVTGALPVSNGGTGTTTITGVLIGNGSSVSGVSTSSGIAGALSDETGTGALVFGTGPTVTSLTVASGGATISAGGLTVTAGGASVIGNILINNSGSAGELRFREPSGSGSNYTAFRAQAQSVDVTYTLPATAPTSNGQVLSSNTGGSMSWITAGSGWALTGNAGTNSSTEYLGTSDAQPLIIRTSATTRLTIAAAGDATFTGNVTAPAFFETSDLRLKDIIKRDGDLIYFKWKDRRDELLHIGYAAQEVQLNNPDQVRVDQAGMLAVNYIEILTEKVRMLEKRIEQLEKKKKRRYE
jgi:hypothetical protein